MILPVLDDQPEAWWYEPFLSVPYSEGRYEVTDRRLSPTMFNWVRIYPSTESSEHGWSEVGPISVDTSYSGQSECFPRRAP